METLGERLKEARRRAGLSQSALARRIGVTPQSIQAIECGRVLGSRHAVAMARVLEVSPDWLSNGYGPMQVEGMAMMTRQEAGAQAPESEAAVAEGAVLEWQGEMPAQGKIPVLAAARGGNDQEMFIEDGPIDYLLVPPVLRNVPRAYAMVVVGDSMVPMYFPGMIVYVNPNKEPRLRQGVVVWKRSKAILIKQLVRRHVRHVVLREYAPERRDFEIPYGEVEALHAIVGTDDDWRL